MLSHKERTVLSWIDRAERRVKREGKYPNKGAGEMRNMISSSKCEYLISSSRGAGYTNCITNAEDKSGVLIIGQSSEATRVRHLKQSWENFERFLTGGVQCLTGL